MDMTDTIIPRSDQMNAEDLLTGPRTFTIKEVRKSGSDDQPVEVVLVEFPPGRPFKPSKTVRRIMVAAWGAEAANYAGHRLTLYRDPLVRFGGQDVGGIRVSHMSHIEKPLSIALTVTRGKRAPYRVEPLPDDAPTSPAVSEATLDELFGLFARKGIAEDAQLAGVNRITGGAATDLEVITEAEARQVIGNLENRPDVTEQNGAYAPPPDPGASDTSWPEAAQPGTVQPETAKP
jgi:hypothetical protein